MFIRACHELILRNYASAGYISIIPKLVLKLIYFKIK
jgi:hypothetical protein